MSNSLAPQPFGAGLVPPSMHSVPPPPSPIGVPMDQSSESDDPPPLPSDAGQTLYVQNLNEKVKLETMKATLTNLFSNYATVLSVTAHTNLRMRGQAFVSLDDVHAADKARREAHLFPLYGKAMKISFAKSKSDAVVLQKLKDEGGHESEMFKQHKEQRLQHKKKARRDNVLRRKELEKKIRAKKAATGEISQPEKAAPKRTQQQMPDEYLPPNKMLFLQNIPEGVGKGELESLFSAYVASLECRLMCCSSLTDAFWLAFVATCLVATDTQAMSMSKPSLARPKLLSSSLQISHPALQLVAPSMATISEQVTSSRQVIRCFGMVSHAVVLRY